MGIFFFPADEETILQRSIRDQRLKYSRIAIATKVIGNCFQIYIFIQWRFGAILSKREKQALFEALKTHVCISLTGF